MARNRIRPNAQQAGAQAAPDIHRSPDNPNPITAPNSAEQTNTIIERAHDPNGEGKLIPSPIRGGNYGVIPEAATRIGIHVGRPVKQNDPAQLLPKKFIITGPCITQAQHPYAGKITFMYDHQRVYVNPGKEVTAAMYDLDLLRRQGLKLEEVVDPLGDARAVQEPPVEEQEPVSDDGDEEDGAESDDQE